MARKLRVEYEGAIYHVISRGDRQEPIIRDNTDRMRFVETLGEACAKTDWEVHAYCLMGNHFHLGRAGDPEGFGGWPANVRTPLRGTQGGGQRARFLGNPPWLGVR